MTGVFPVVKGVRLRATKINNCGLPIPGPRNRIVTDGFVKVTLTPVWREPQDLEQVNAEGKICVADRTPPTRKWHTAAVDLCNVNSGLITLFNGWPQVLDYADSPIGYQDATDVDGDYGVALEIWTGGKSLEDCPVPSLDTLFSSPSSGLHYGYFLFGVVEAQLGGIDIGAQVSTFTLTGITVAMPQWGRGPYNVAGTDVNGTPGRLLTAVGDDAHYTAFRTPVAPPAITNGGDPQPLDILGKFVAPNYYFGGPSNAPAVDVAPSQDDAHTVTVSITGGPPTGGNFVLDANGLPATIAWNSTAAAAKSALVALDDGYGASDWTVTGGALPGTPLVITPPIGVTLTLGTNALTPSGTVVLS